MAAHRAAPTLVRPDRPPLPDAGQRHVVLRDLLGALVRRCSRSLSDNVLGASIHAVGLAIAFYYGLTGFACVVYFRKSIFKSVKNFFFVGVAPLVGGVMLFAMLYKAGSDYRQGHDRLRLGVRDRHVVRDRDRALLLGIPLMLLWWMRSPAFFRRGRDPFPRPEPDGTGPPAPPILGVGPIRDDVARSYEAGSTTEGGPDDR